MKDIGLLLKERRLENGVSLAEAADDLGVDEAALENMEEGNTRAFKDMYTLKELMKDYSKYLGMDVNDIVEEFNDFLFEHTSKISLEAIQEAKSKLQDTASRKIVSPYTKIPKKKFDYQKVLRPFFIVVFILLLILFLFSLFQKDEKRSRELKSVRGVEFYEFA